MNSTNTTSTNTIKDNNTNKPNNSFGKIASPEMFSKFIRDSFLTTKGEMIVLDYLVGATHGGYNSVSFTNQELSVILNLNKSTISDSLVSLKKKGLIHTSTICQRYQGSKYKSKRTIKLNKNKYYGTDEERIAALEEEQLLLEQVRQQENRETEAEQKEVVEETSKFEPLTEPSKESPYTYQGFEF